MSDERRRCLGVDYSGGGLDVHPARRPSVGGLEIFRSCCSAAYLVPDATLSAGEGATAYGRGTEAS